MKRIIGGVIFVFTNFKGRGTVFLYWEFVVVWDEVKDGGGVLFFAETAAPLEIALFVF